MPERSDTQNEKARIIERLYRSGVPLELRALQLVREFCKKKTSGGLRAYDLGPILWSNNANEAYREVDAVAMLRESMQFAEITLTIEAHYFVEAKYRHGEEWFAFEGPQSARFPVASNACCSEGLIEACHSGTESIRLSRLSAMNTEARPKDQGKEQPSKEQITRNVSASLADVVLYFAQSTLPFLRDEGVFYSIKDAAVVPKLKQDMLQIYPDFPKDTLREYLSKIPTEEHVKFLSDNRGTHPIVVRCFFPVMVVNGRVSEVVMRDGVIEDVRPMAFALTGERLPSWRKNDLFVAPSDHFPMYVTNLGGLQATLEAGYDYVCRLRGRLADEAVRGRFNMLALDSAITASVMSQAGTPIKFGTGTNGDDASRLFL